MPGSGSGMSSNQRPGWVFLLTRAFMFGFRLGTTTPGIGLRKVAAPSIIPDVSSDILDNAFRYARKLSAIMNTPRASRPKAAASAPPAVGDSSDALNRHLGARVKRLRAGRGWSLEVLANASGVSRSMLSQIEREQANPTLAVTLRIARAFGMALGELIEMPGATSSVTVIHRDDRAYHYRSDRDCMIRTLSPLNLE